MSKNYGDNPPLSYNKYLRVQDLINLQECLSTPAHHDELLFITVHQAYELWFKQILHEIDAAIVLLEEDRVPAATRAVQRVVEIEKLLVNQIHILERMTPISFLAFRDQLNPASGFQSMQFREIEFSSGLKDSAILREFSSDEFAYERLRARLEQPVAGRLLLSRTSASWFHCAAYNYRRRRNRTKESLRRTHSRGTRNTHTLRRTLRRVSTRGSTSRTRRILLTLALASHQDG